MSITDGIARNSNWITNIYSDVNQKGKCYGNKYENDM